MSKCGCTIDRVHSLDFFKVFAVLDLLYSSKLNMDAWHGHA